MLAKARNTQNNACFHYFVLHVLPQREIIEIYIHLLGVWYAPVPVALVVALVVDGVVTLVVDGVVDGVVDVVVSGINVGCAVPRDASPVLAVKACNFIMLSSSTNISKKDFTVV